MQSLSSSRACGLSLVELLIGGFIVIGHNVFHLLPNEVPILFILGWISLRLRDGGWEAAGLTRPKSWWKTVALAVGAAAILQAGSELVVGPLGHRIWPAPEHVSHAVASAALGWRQSAYHFAHYLDFCRVWRRTIVRGYSLTRAADVYFPRPLKRRLLYRHSRCRVLFGFRHYYRGHRRRARQYLLRHVCLARVPALRPKFWASECLAHGISGTRSPSWWCTWVWLLGWSCICARDESCAPNRAMEPNAARFAYELRL